MATSTISFNGQLTGASRTEYYCDLDFTPPANISGKLCYVQAKGFAYSGAWSGKAAWNTLQLYNDWPQVDCVQVDFNPAVMDSGGFTCSATNGSTALTSVNPPIGYVVGRKIVGTGFSSGTTITAISGTDITLSSAFTGTTGTSVGAVFFNTENQRQLRRGPLAAYNDYALMPFKTLVSIPNGPHRIRFTVKRADKGVIAGSVTQTAACFFVVFEIVPANSRQPPLN